MLPVLALPFVGLGATEAILGASALATASAFLGYEYFSSDSPPTLSVGAPTGEKPLPVPRRPSIAPVLKPAVDSHSASREASKTALDTQKQNLQTTAQSKSAYNNALKESFFTAPLLGNQIELKHTLDEIALALNGQSAVYAMIYESLERNFQLLNSSILTIAQNNKVVTDMQTSIAISSDYGDDNFFFSFEPTHEYWSKVDLATIEFYQDLGWNVPTPLPSVMGALGELSIVDNYQEQETKSQVRSRIEAYRRSSVPDNIRSRLGLSLVNAKTKEAEGAKAQTDYYTKAVEGAKLAEGAIARDYGDTASRATAEALAVVAKWAETAKTKDEFLTTPRTARDANGVSVLEGVTPLEVALAKDVALAKGEADTNSIGTGTIDFIEELFDDMDLGGDMFKRYVRIDEMLKYAKDNPDAGSDGWESLMQGLFT